MITKHTIYVLTCDKCHKTYSDDYEGYMTWHYRKRDVIRDARLDDWFFNKKTKNQFCPECAKRLLKEAEKC